MTDWPNKWSILRIFFSFLRFHQSCSRLSEIDADDDLRWFISFSGRKLKHAHLPGLDSVSSRDSQSWHGLQIILENWKPSSTYSVFSCFSRLQLNSNLEASKRHVDHVENYVHGSILCSCWRLTGFARKRYMDISWPIIHGYRMIQAHSDINIRILHDIQVLYWWHTHISGVLLLVQIW